MIRDTDKGNRLPAYTNKLKSKKKANRAGSEYSATFYNFFE